jgi:hypothetical protein
LEAVVCPALEEAEGMAEGVAVVCLALEEGEAEGALTFPEVSIISYPLVLFYNAPLKLLVFNKLCYY